MHCSNISLRYNAMLMYPVRPCRELYWFCLKVGEKQLTYFLINAIIISIMNKRFNKNKPSSACRIGRVGLL